ncbi:aromatic ring-hydroxylating dioxygenase subunit alpha [Nitrosomonas sp.]|uniref:aromatic ring-hydroxylating oxygenase subunit alpha n=1 Tax=Nitrosomonas sp. TaxID=42353 RepID=UPI00374D779B
MKKEPLRKFNPDDAGFSYTLASEYYTSPVIYENELEVIFANSWNFGCHLSQVNEPGKYIRCKVGDEEIVITRDKENKLHSYYNVCRHRAHTLIQNDFGKVNFITCPYHAWTYNLDGTARTVRNCENVEGFCKEEFSLEEARVEELAGFVWVNLNADAEPLIKQAPDLEAKLLEHCPDIHNLKFAHRETWDIKANWKTAIDNFSECYHCATAHPGFVDLVSMPDYTVTTHGIWNAHVSPVPENPNGPLKVAAAVGKRLEYVAIYLWPNMTMWIMPGAGNIGLLYMLPTGPETTRENMDFYFLDEKPTEEEMASIEYLREVLQPEDVDLCEKVQKGLKSRSYDIGRLLVDHKRSGISEHAVHHFQSLVYKAHHAKEYIQLKESAGQAAAKAT